MPEIVIPSFSFHKKHNIHYKNNLCILCFYGKKEYGFLYSE
jgi:hypothetical protein